MPGLVKALRDGGWVLPGAMGECALARAFTELWCAECGCCSCEPTRASSMNIAVNSSLEVSAGNTRFTATGRRKPAAPRHAPRHIV